MGSTATRQLRRSQYRASRASSASATGVVSAPNTTGQNTLAGTCWQAMASSSQTRMSKVILKANERRTARVTGAAKVAAPTKAAAQPEFIYLYVLTENIVFTLLARITALSWGPAPHE
jgi:hypothetical protein